MVSHAGRFHFEIHSAEVTAGGSTLSGEEIRTGIGVMVDYAAIAPGRRGDDQVMLEALSALTRDDALFHCAKVNTIATGFDPNLSHAERQRRLAQTYCDPEQGAAINAFVTKHGG